MSPPDSPLPPCHHHQPTVLHRLSPWVERGQSGPSFCSISPRPHRIRHLGDLRPQPGRGSSIGGRGSKASRYPFFLLVKESAREGGAGTTNASYLTVRPGRSGSCRRRAPPAERAAPPPSPPGLGTATAAPEGMRGGGWGLGERRRHVSAFLSLSLQSPALRPSPHHHSPLRVTGS